MQKIATREERAAAISKARNKLLSTRDALNSSEAQELYLTFMSRYAQMEVAYKSLLADYSRAHGKKVVENSLKVERAVIPRVLAYFSIDLSEIDRIQVFDGKPKIGERCAS